MIDRYTGIPCSEHTIGGSVIGAGAYLAAYHIRLYSTADESVTRRGRPEISCPCSQTEIEWIVNDRNRILQDYRGPHSDGLHLVGTHDLALELCEQQSSAQPDCSTEADLDSLRGELRDTIARRNSIQQDREDEMNLARNIYEDSAELIDVFFDLHDTIIGNSYELAVSNTYGSLRNLHSEYIQDTTINSIRGDHSSNSRQAVENVRFKNRLRDRISSLRNVVSILDVVSTFYNLGDIIGETYNAFDIYFSAQRYMFDIIRSLDTVEEYDIQLGQIDDDILELNQRLTVRCPVSLPSDLAETQNNIPTPPPRSPRP